VSAETATDRREQILAVATELFARHGFAVTSLDDIARVIGFTKPAIYYWFDSKDAILFEIHDRIVRDAVSRVRAIRASGDPPHVQLRRVLAEHVKTLLDNVDANTVFEREGHMLSDEHRASIRRRDQAYERTLREIYAEGIADGALRDVDPKLAVGTLLGACNWAHRWFRPQRALSAEDVAEAIVDLLAEGAEVRSALHPSASP
jgi:AcrR family transcriptional regulator